MLPPLRAILILSRRSGHMLVYCSRWWCYVGLPTLVCVRRPKRRLLIVLELAHPTQSNIKVLYFEIRSHQEPNLTNALSNSHVHNLRRRQPTSNDDDIRRSSLLNLMSHVGTRKLFNFRGMAAPLLLFIGGLEGEDLSPAGSDGQHHSAGIECVAGGGCHSEYFLFCGKIRVRVIFNIGDFAVEDCTGVVEAVAGDNGRAVIFEEAGRWREVVFSIPFVNLNLADRSAQVSFHTASKDTMAGNALLRLLLLLLLLMLAQLLPHTPRDLPEIFLPSRLLRICKHPIPIPRINVEEHRTPKLLDLQCPERPIPLLHPLITSTIQHLYR